MKKYLKYIPFIVLAAALTTFTSCDDDDDDNNTPAVAPMLTIEFDHLAGNQKFYLDSTYTTENGDAFTATLFKYYVSNIRLVKGDNTEIAVDDTYFLINQDDETSFEVELENLPAGDFKGIKFLVGVDSSRNVSGAQEGALDPVNGMFWDWNTGYIFLKLEGSSPVIPTGSQTFTWHIGGFASPNNNGKEIYLEFDGDNLPLANNTHPELHLVLNVLEIFKTSTTIDLATFPTMIMSANANAAILANNYSDMFRYDHIHAD